jgi:signal transduction histidine kinase
MRSARLSIRLRFTVALTAIAAVLFGGYAIWGYRSERGDLRAATTRELRLIGQSLETSLGNALRDRQRADIEETLKALDALAPDLDVYVHDSAGTVIARSKGARDDAALRALARDASVLGGELVRFEAADDGDRLTFAAPLTGDDGTPLGALAISRPVSDLERDLARTRIRLVTAMLALLLATAIAGLVLGTIHVSRPIGRLRDGIRQIREGDFRTQVQADRHDEIGELVVEFNRMIAALADERSRAEAEADARTRLEQGLQRVDKLVTIGQLSAGLAHEIGSPLQVLSGRAATLLDHADPEVQRQAAQLTAQCERITRVVEQLLSFGRRKAAAVEACDLSEPVRAVIDLLAGEARRRGISLTMEVLDPPHVIEADRDQLQQVALNLVKNALVATPSGGIITVRVDRLDNKVRLSIRDNGVGIDSATRARLFEPFFTTRAAEGGTGLGLAVVRSIADEHRARIDVNSSPGAGAEFVVSFTEVPRG